MGKEDLTPKGIKAVRKKAEEMAALAKNPNGKRTHRFGRRLKVKVR